MTNACDNELKSAVIVDEVCSAARTSPENTPLQAICEPLVRGFLRDPCEEDSSYTRHDFCETVKLPSATFCETQATNVSIPYADKFCEVVNKDVIDACPEPVDYSEAGRTVAGVMLAIGGIVLGLGGVIIATRVINSDGFSKGAFAGATLLGGASIYGAVEMSIAILATSIEVPVAYAIGTSTLLVGASTLLGATLGKSIANHVSSFWNRRQYQPPTDDQPKDTCVVEEAEPQKQIEGRITGP